MLLSLEFNGNVVIQVFEIRILTNSSDHLHSGKVVHASSAVYALLLIVRDWTQI